MGCGLTSFNTIYDFARDGFVDLVNGFFDGFGGGFAGAEGGGEGTAGLDAQLGGEEAGLTGEGSAYGLHFEGMDEMWLFILFGFVWLVG